MKKLNRVEKIAVLTLIIVAVGMISVMLRDKYRSEYLENYFKDKTVLILGDSISDTEFYPDCWVRVFEERLKGIAMKVDNYSLMGRTIAQYAESGNNTLMDILPEIAGGGMMI